MAVELDLLEGIESELKTLFGSRGNVQKRIAPIRERREFADDELKVTPYWNGGGYYIKNRGLDTEGYVIGIALQRPVPQANTSQRGEFVFSGIDDIPFAGEMFDLAREVMDLWHPDDIDDPEALRNRQIAGCQFLEIDREHLFEPQHLITKAVFSIVIDVLYGRTICDEDE